MIILDLTIIGLSAVLLFVWAKRAWRSGKGVFPRCRRCGYSAVGLPAPRCPECGVELRWDAGALEWYPPRQWVWWLGTAAAIAWSLLVFGVAQALYDEGVLSLVAPILKRGRLEARLDTNDPTISCPYVILIRGAGTTWLDPGERSAEHGIRIPALDLEVANAPELGTLHVQLDDLRCLPPDGHALNVEDWVPFDTQAVANWLAGGVTDASDADNNAANDTLDDMEDDMPDGADDDTVDDPNSGGCASDIAEIIRDNAAFFVVGRTMPSYYGWPPQGWSFVRGEYISDVRYSLSAELAYRFAVCGLWLFGARVFIRLAWHAHRTRIDD